MFLKGSIIFETFYGFLDDFPPMFITKIFKIDVFKTSEKGKLYILRR